MNDIIKIDVSDRTIKEDRKLMIYKLKEFMEANMTNEEELIGLMGES